MRTIKITLAIVLFIVLSLSFSAHVSSNSEIYYQEKDVTVAFDTDSILPSDKKQLIADKIVFGSDNLDEGTSTYSFCWLLGHDIISEIVYVIEHKVSSTVPRCSKKTYDVQTCENCDHMEYTLVSSVMILCCPEE